MIYLDNSATSFFKPPEVSKVLIDYLKSPGNPERGINSASINAGLATYGVREKVAEFFKFSNPSCVIWTSGITESLNTAINGIFKKDDHIITTYLEHNSVLRPLYRIGCELSFTSGDFDEIKKCIKKNTKAVIISHVSNVTGEIQDITKIGKWARERGILFIVDSAQSAGVLEIDVEKSCIDILCFAGHKGLLGLQGTGGIVINNDVKIKPLKAGGTGVKSFSLTQPDEYPNALEAGTQNIPGILALGAGVDYINSKGINFIREHELKLCSAFLQYLETCKNIEIYQNKAKSRLGVISFNIKNKDSSVISDYFSNNYNIAIRSGAMCAPLAMKYYNITSCCRVSFGLNNTEKDVETLIKATEEIQ